MATHNPLLSSLEDAERLLSALEEASVDLEEAIANHAILKAQLTEINDTVASMEAEIVMEAEFAGADGPLGGIAKTSKTYAYALGTLLTAAHRDTLAEVWAQKKRLEVEEQNASIQLRQAEVHFSAIRRAADLRAAMLKALATI